MNDPSGKASFAATGFTTADFPTGLAQFVCLEFAFGTELRYIPAESASLRTLYVHSQVFGNFEIILHFTSFDDYQAASGYFDAYIAWVNGDSTTQVQPMMCSYDPYIPEMPGWLLFGIPSQGQSYGMEVGQFVWTLRMGFTGTYQMVNETTQASYQGATNDQAASQFFYPEGIQQGSASSALETIIYNNPNPIKPTNSAYTKTQLSVHATGK